MTRHRLDLFSLLSGLILVGIALVALFGVTLDIAAWVWPTILIGVGLVVLASVLASSRRDAGVATGDGEPAPEEHDDLVAEARQEVEAADRTSD